MSQALALRSRIPLGLRSGLSRRVGAKTWATPVSQDFPLEGTKACTVGASSVSKSIWTSFLPKAFSWDLAWKNQE